jgi:hypothetical protein
VRKSRKIARLTKKFKTMILIGISEKRKQVKDITREDLINILKENGYYLTGIQAIEAFIEFKGVQLEKIFRSRSQ